MRAEGEFCVAGPSPTHPARDYRRRVTTPRCNTPSVLLGVSPKIMAENLGDNPQLRPFVLSNVRLTGTRIGAGAYGSVEEVTIPVGAAAKKNPRHLPGPLRDP